MPDPIKAAFTGRWRLDIAPVDGGGIAFVQVLLCQEAWRRLTVRSRRALLAIGEEPARTAHPNTVACLRAHGLVDDSNRLTHPGRAVLRHRPVKTGTPDWIAGRPVINVHLPEPVTT